jgi:hypothetical protein
MKRWLVLFAIPAVLAAQEKEKKPRPMAEVTLRLIEASSAANAPNDAADLVPAELKSLLRFTRYHLLDSAFVRGTEEESMRIMLAGRDMSGRIKFELRERQPVPVMEFEVEIDGAPGSTQRAQRLLETTTTAKSGETVVLGASRMRDAQNALIVLLTGKLLP